MIDPQLALLTAVQLNLSYWLGRKSSLLNADQPSQRGWLFLVKGYCALSLQDRVEARRMFEKSLLEWIMAGNKKMQFATKNALDSLTSSAASPDFR
jgi:hypothetical protein